MKKGILFQVSIYLLSLSILAALYTFVIIPQVRKKSENKYKEIFAQNINNYVPVLVYQGDTPLLSGVIITEVNRDNFRVEKMPGFCLVDNAVSDFSYINGRELKYTITSGQQISFDHIAPGDFDISESKRLKEYRVSSLVGEHARKGTCVDILGRYPDGSYEVLIQKIRIYDILSDEKGYIRDRDGFYTILIAVDEDEFRILDSAQLTGYLDTRLYISEMRDLL